MEMDNEKKLLLTQFVETLATSRMLEIYKTNGNYHLKVDSIKIDGKNIEKFSWDIVSEEKFKPFRDFILSFRPSIVFLEYLKREVRDHSLRKQRAEQTSGNGFQSFDYSQLRPFFSVDNEDASVFIDSETMSVVYASLKVYEKVVPKGLQQTPIVGIIRFDPFSPERIKNTLFANQSVTQVNTYQIPSWQFARELTSSEVKEFSHLPNILDNFFRALFPSQDSREFVYDWLHFAITKRCETYLVLNGAKGIGKGIFTDYICRKLMGDRNWKQAAPSALESNFNAMLVDTRMIIFDEMPINDSEKVAKLKKYINKDQAIEFKGVDVGETITTYNSFIISSNNLSDIKIEWDDRRFSVMDLTELKLDQIWSKDTIDSLVAALEDESIIRSFGYWLMYRNPTGNEFTVHKGDHFWKLCYTSLPEWSKCIVDEISTGCYDTIDDETLKMKYREGGSKFPFPKLSKVEDFIKSYRHQEKGYLGTLDKNDNGGWTITVSNSFYRGRDDTGYDWQELV